MPLRSNLPVLNGPTKSNQLNSVLAGLSMLPTPMSEVEDVFPPFEKWLFQFVEDAAKKNPDLDAEAAIDMIKTDPKSFLTAKQAYEDAKGASKPAAKAPSEIVEESPFAIQETSKEAVPEKLAKRAKPSKATSATTQLASRPTEQDLLKNVRPYEQWSKAERLLGTQLPQNMPPEVESQALQQGLKQQALANFDTVFNYLRTQSHISGTDFYDLKKARELIEAGKIDEAKTIQNRIVSKMMKK